MSYSSGGFGGFSGYSGYSTYYSPPTIFMATAVSDGSSGGRVRSQLAPAMAVPQDSTLLLAAWSAPTNDNRAVVVIAVPDAQAKVWVEGSCTSMSGRIRRFISPPLNQGSLYEYNVNAQWVDASGRERTDSQTVTIRAGGVVNVVFAGRNP